MYKLEKPRNKEERFRPDSANPSFSSTLLDQIYRSIDVDNTKSPSHLKFYRDKTKKHTTELPGSTMLMTKSRTRCNADKKVNNYNMSMDDHHQKQRRHDFVELERKFLLLQQQRKHDPDFDQDLLFFSSTSNSSDSSSGGFSSSDTDSLFASRSTSLPPPPTMPKPVKTARALFYGNDGVVDGEKDAVIKSKSRALKIYNKVKQPISPGGKVANFINSLFTAGTPKRKSKDSKSSCSSASSFSRSCLSNNSPSTREKIRNGEKRSVRFYPVSVTVDEESRPCGQKRLPHEQQAVQSTAAPSSVSLPNAWKMGRSDVDGDGDVNRKVMEKSRRVEELGREFLKDYHRIERKQVNLEEEGMEDDVSCSSSDLFELDHNALVMEREDIMLSEELPVFETTRFHSNRLIANRFL